MSTQTGEVVLRERGASLLSEAHFVCLAVPHYRRVWTKDEDDGIRALVAKYGTRSWSVISEHMVTGEYISRGSQ